jgi:hypothetical protein
MLAGGDGGDPSQRMPGQGLVMPALSSYGDGKTGDERNSVDFFEHVVTNGVQTH